MPKRRYVLRTAFSKLPGPGCETGSEAPACTPSTMSALSHARPFRCGRSCRAREGAFPNIFEPLAARTRSPDSTRRRSERSSRDKPSVCHRSLAVTTEKKSRHSVLATNVCLPETSFTRSVSSASSRRSSTAKIACDAGCDHHDPWTGSRATIPATLGNTGSVTRSSPCRSSSRRTLATLTTASYPQRDRHVYSLRHQEWYRHICR